MLADRVADPSPTTKDVQFSQGAQPTPPPAGALPAAASRQQFIALVCVHVHERNEITVLKSGELFPQSTTELLGRYSFEGK